METKEIRCPKCGSNQITANKKGFSGTKAVGGAILTGGIGLLAGTIGSNKVKITCLACGKEFSPGQDFDAIQTQKAKNKALWKKMKKPAKWVAFILLIFFLIGIIGSFFAPNPKDIPSPATNKNENKIIDSMTKANLAEYAMKAKEDSMAAIEWNSTKAGKIYKQHPEWSKEDCEKIANNKIWIGMSYDMLVYKRGKPNTVNTSNSGNGNEYQACWDDYNPSCFYFGEDRIITSYN